MRDSDRLYLSKFAIDLEYDAILDDTNWLYLENSREGNELSDLSGYDDWDEDI